MTLPDVVRTNLDGEPVVDRIPLGGEDRLFVTPTRLLRYRGESLLSDESVEEVPRSADRISVSERRRTTAITLEYAGDERVLSVPPDRLETVLGPLLAGILSADDVIGADERLIEAFRFDELTAVVTDRRLIEHVGAAVWDGEYEELPFEDVTGLEVERGRVATGIVLSTGDRRKRIKIHNDRARPFEERLREAIRAYHGVESIDDLADEEERENHVGKENESGVDASPLASVDPLAVVYSETDDRGERPTEPGENGQLTPEPESIEGELEALSEALERQEALLEKQRRTIERIRETVTRDRDR
ncbi:DUF7115 domain-containing protein [Halalkalicoccus ordinarius]|uniref:DUF7115 domain-containing protein n=1 Tax=Halalkalicoccus ordinarius TaxID=3116651 RepID=UPI00300ED9E5